MSLRRVASLSVVAALSATGCGYPEINFGAQDADAEGTTNDTPPPQDSASPDVSAEVPPDATLPVDAEDAEVPAEDAEPADTLADSTTPDVADTSVQDTLVLDTPKIDVAPEAAPTYTTFVSFGSTWKYRDDNVPPGTTWNGGGSFDDSTWKSGLAPLGYGTGSEKTVVSYGPDGSNKYVTTWFRKTFTVSDESKYDQLRLRMQRDDGAVVYLNGTEILRTNMPSGTITPSTFASSVISDETAVHTFYVSVGPLKTGTNVLAVEIHQANLTSSDIRMDAELVGRDPP